MSVHYRVAPNIALIKYWGKLDSSLLIPLSSSLSLTLSIEDLYTETEVEFYFPENEKEPKDLLNLNGVDTPINSRLKKMISFFRGRYEKEQEKKNIKDKINENLSVEEKKEKTSDFLNEIRIPSLQITSINNFPTAAGLASSSSGYAAMALCLAEIFNFQQEYQGQLSEIARMGSGSATRSLEGGAVEWVGGEEEVRNREWDKVKRELEIEEKTKEELSKKCVARQVFGPEKFHKWKILILMPHNEEKDVGSTDGMKLSVLTSDLIESRVKAVVPERMKLIKRLMEEDDFNGVMELIIKDSNQFHAICLDTYPPLFYLNEFSKKIMQIVSELNKILAFKVGYTFDAGPHAVLFVHENVFFDVFKFIIELSDLPKEKLNEKGRNSFDLIPAFFTNEDVQKLFTKTKGVLKIEPDRVIQTCVGSGPIKIQK